MKRQQIGPQGGHETREPMANGDGWDIPQYTISEEISPIFPRSGQEGAVHMKPKIRYSSRAP